MRTPADTAARSTILTKVVADLLPRKQPIRILDLATGTGANLRYLAPRLPSPQEWLVVDRDAALLAEVPENKEELPDLLLKMAEGEFSLSISGQTLRVKRRPKEEEASDEDALPDDIEDEFPGA